MRLIQSSIADVVVIEPTVFKDERGWFMESFNDYRFQQALEQLGVPTAGKFVQDNHSCSQQGVLRGLHYQLPPKAQGKLVRVVQGAVWDVAVDLRKDSMMFGQWVGIELSADNQKQLWIPPGFAHGFVTLTQTAEFLYKTTDYYSPTHERAIRWDDIDLAITWPIDTDCIQVSAKDQQAASFAKAELF